jgi:hypothetical protein
MSFTKPIRVKTDLHWRQLVYLKNDPEQLPHELVGLTIKPGAVDGKNVVIFHVDYCGDTVEMYDFQCSLERGEGMNNDPSKPEDPEEEEGEDDDN